MSIKDCTKVPLEKLKTPKAGRLCYGPSWWTVTDDNCVLFYKRFSPQCNADRRCAESIRDRLYPGLRVEFVEMAFIEHDCHDYV